MKGIIRKWLGISDDYLFLRNKLSEHYILIDTLKNTKCPCEEGLGTSIEKNSKLEYIFGSLKAIENHLGGRSEWYWKDDPTIIPPQHPQIRDWKFVKNKRKK